ncbi:MAG: HDIG domain-containing protein, partial [Planctomycetes bacterium]|nr:HDIG domain-containing protein [Planctomycetota bacterium]
MARRLHRPLSPDLFRPPQRRQGESRTPIPGATGKVTALVLFGISLVLLLSYRPSSRDPLPLLRLAGTAVLGATGLYLLSVHFLHSHRRAFRRTRRILPVFLFSLLVLGLAKLACHVEGWPPFLLPVSLASLLFTISMGRQASFDLTVVLYGLLALSLASETPELFGRPVAHTLVVLAPGALLGVIFGERVRKRSTLIELGLGVGAANAFALAAITLAAGDASAWASPALHAELLWAFGHGLAVGLVLTGLLPAIEVAFEVTTDIRLLELSTLHHPLLQALSIRAPGTYHHSLLVGQLAEAAAEAVGANGLLCRVGAYYHDIGKVIRPGFFVENGFYYEILHSRLSPGMSSLVILAHVKDGLELARLHRLPEPIVEVIQQHQGVGTLDLFYRKALEELGPRAVDRGRFSYPGPLPQSLEVGIVALADSVEAAYRYLSEPSPEAVKKAVKKAIQRKIDEGLLDDAPMTLRQ